MEKPDVIRKIRKLMRVAEPDRGATEQEVETAMRMVDDLMRKHNLSMSECAHENEAVVVVESEETALKIAKTWHRLIASAVGDLCEVTVIRTRRPGQRWHAFRFIGTAHDVALAKEILEMLLFEIWLAGKQYPNERDKRSFSEGFAAAVVSRVAKILDERIGASGALVFVGRKKAAITVHLNDKKINEEGKAARLNDHQTKAFLDGLDAGGKADLKPKRKLEA